VLCEFFAVLKIELFLSAFFGRARGCVRARLCVLQDRCAELFVDQDAGLILRYPGSKGSPEAIVDHLLARGDLDRLF